ncbi:hypothetical protein EWM64_g2482 [Hericium alpestre]|uniref:Probable quinone oxidoreductase n=1 Tax=Hericium alpestre TaxID=135208 RepID=A0A4Z0A3D9_9AGAM|nr:hypothetical protein EWM64_g2482 [Hericium alpestre]
MPYPTTIRAVGIHKTGDVDVIEDLTLPFPARKPGDILVKVQYAGVNFIDIYYRTGLYPVPSFPFAISGEVAGVIEELPSDEAVLNSEKYKQRGFKKGGKITFMQQSSLAEYVTIPWDGPIFSVPDGISTRIAAAALAQGLSAIVHSTKSYDVKKGDTILIHTVAGGLGLLMCQVAKSRGATVIGTTSTPAKAELAKAHGADHVILYTQENTVQRVAEITDGLGPHAIFDGVGKDTFDIDFKMIRCNGTLVSLGNSSGAVPPFSPLRLSEKNVRLLYPSLFNYLVTPEQRSYWGTKLWRLVAAGDLKINIFQDYPFTAEGVRRAQVDLTEGKTVGKLLIRVADGVDSQT